MIIIARGCDPRVYACALYDARGGASSQYCDIRYNDVAEPRRACYDTSVLRAKRDLDKRTRTIRAERNDIRSRRMFDAPRSANRVVATVSSDGLRMQKHHRASIRIGGGSEAESWMLRRDVSGATIALKGET
jgi:hypothetical protein